MKRALLEILGCPGCHSPLEILGGCGSSARDAEILDGALRCGACDRVFPIHQGVPDLRGEHRTGTVSEQAGRVYGYLWSRDQQQGPGGQPARRGLHFRMVQEAIPPLAIRGSWALDIGCGDGADCLYLADTYPAIQWIGLDIHSSVGALQTAARLRPNLHVVRASASALPIQSAAVDFVYSYGVLHHLDDPRGGLAELMRVLHPDGTFAFYVYEAHEETWWKRLPIAWVAQGRRLTTRLPAPVLYRLCWLASPVVVLSFAWPARVAAACPLTRAWSAKIPFHFGRGLFSLTGDLYDRFGSPIEHRFTRRQLSAWFEQAAISGDIVHPRAVAGWIGWGRKRAMEDVAAVSGHGTD